eukprot:403349677
MILHQESTSVRFSEEDNVSNEPPQQAFDKHNFNAQHNQYINNFGAKNNNNMLSEDGSNSMGPSLPAMNIGLSSSKMMSSIIQQTPSNLLGSQHRINQKNQQQQMMADINMLSPDQQNGSTDLNNNNDFNLFSHHKFSQSARVNQENYETLKEALLELYLSVKIRSDDEIDCYTEEQFKQEKDMMKEVDGFTLIDYIKSSIEILMNMKIEENEQQQKDLGQDTFKHINFESKKKSKKLKNQNLKEDNKSKERAIPKIDDKTPTSSILDLQLKLEQVSSPASSNSSHSQSTCSIPAAHKEYEKALRALESECRNHIKVEQQMKLHIECLQEKLDSTTKERDQLQSSCEETSQEHEDEIQKLNKIIKTLEEELMNKAEKIKELETSMKENLPNRQGIIQKSQNVLRSHSEIGNYQLINKPANSSRESSQQRSTNPRLSASVLDIQRESSMTERNVKSGSFNGNLSTHANANMNNGSNNPYLVDSYNRLSKHIIQTDVINKSMSNFNHAGNLSGGNGMLSGGVLSGNQDSTRRSSQVQQSTSDGHKRSKSQAQMNQLVKSINMINSNKNQFNLNVNPVHSDQQNQPATNVSFFKSNKNQQQSSHQKSQQHLKQQNFHQFLLFILRASFSKIGLKGMGEGRSQNNSQLNTSRNENNDLYNNAKNSHRRNIQQHSQSISYHPFQSGLPSTQNVVHTAGSVNNSQIQPQQNSNQTNGNTSFIMMQNSSVQLQQNSHQHIRNKTEFIGLNLNEMKHQQQNSGEYSSRIQAQILQNQQQLQQQQYQLNQQQLQQQQLQQQQHIQPLNSYRKNINTANISNLPSSNNNSSSGGGQGQQNGNSQGIMQYGNSFKNSNYFDINTGPQAQHLRTKSNEVGSLSNRVSVIDQPHTMNNQNYQEKLSKIYLDNSKLSHQNLKKIPKAYLQKVLADSRKQPRNNELNESSQMVQAANIATGSRVANMIMQGEQLLAGYCPINNSTSKQLFSFPKERRFKPPKKQLAPSFGIGQRFKQLAQSPDGKRNRILTPSNHHKNNSYGGGNQTAYFVKTTEDIELPSDFKQSKDKGYSFGASREVYKRVFTKTQPFMQDPEMPGPGTYDLKSFVEKLESDNRQFIIGKRDNHEFPLNYPQYPGPGYYQDNTTINSKGNYFHSKFLNSGSQKFSQNPRNFLRIKSTTPGPGSYDPKVLLNKEGQYFVSTYKNSLVRKFGGVSTNLGSSGYNNTSTGINSLNFSMDAKKLSINNNRTMSNNTRQVVSLRNGTPGPGSYRIISEFGKYDMSSTSPAGGFIDTTTSTTPVKRAFSALGNQGRRKRAQSSMANNQGGSRMMSNDENDLTRAPDHQ